VLIHALLHPARPGAAVQQLFESQHVALGVGTGVGAGVNAVVGAGGVVVVGAIDVVLLTVVCAQTSVTNSVAIRMLTQAIASMLHNNNERVLKCKNCMHARSLRANPFVLFFSWLKKTHTYFVKKKLQQTKHVATHRRSSRWFHRSHSF
jgi:hypothetical protein